MKQSHSVGRMVFMLVGSIAAAMVFCSAAPAQAGFLNSCTYCHGMPPKDGVRKANPHYDSLSSSFSGNHQTHAAGAADCSVCHTAVATTAFGHQNERIDFQSNINTSPATGQYRVGGVAVAFKNQTSIPVLGSCSSVNCHFEKDTPVWGSAPFASPTDCDKCHSASPNTFAHSKHTAITVCATCHTDHSGEVKKFAHATSAGRAISVTVGSYAGSNSKYLPSQTGRVVGSCSTAYCHSAGQTNGATAVATPVISPIWSGSLQTACGSCHVDMATSNSATGSHVKHANTAAIACAVCHNGYTATSVSTGTHVNNTINLGFTGVAGGTTYGKTVSFAPGSGAYSTCTVSYCHSSAQGPTGTGSITYQNPTWGSATLLNCGSCHVDMSSSASATGSHIKHAQASGYSIACSSCHGAGYSSASVVYPGGHVDGFINIGMAGGTYSKGTNFAPGAAYGTCSTSSCHSNAQATPTYATPAWGGSVTCTSCHDTKRSSMTATALSGKHDRHLNYSTNSALGLGNSFNCIDCHAKTVSGNATISDKTKHVNGMADYSGARAGRTYSAGTCSTVYCHSNGNTRGANSLVYINMTGSKTWTGSASFACNGCHGRSHTIGSPDYASGAVGSATANSHPIHVTAAGITDTTGCTNCHAKTADAVIPNKFKDYTANSRHINGLRDVYFRASVGGAAASFNGSTCSSTYCHGAASPVWGTVGSLNCASCHSANNLLPGAHQIHVTTTPVASSYTNMSGNVSTTTNYRFSCAACHKGQHANGAANANGVAEIFYGFTSATMKGSYTYGALGGADSSTFKWSTGGAGCNTTYCHSNGNGSSGASAVAWNTTASSTPAPTACVKCHGDATTLNSNAHAKHVNVAAGKGIGCVTCHANTVIDNSTISNKSKHVNKIKDIGFPTGTLTTGATFAAGTCSTVYCHSNGKGVFASPVSWTGTAACGSCHAATSPLIATNGHAAHTTTIYGPALAATTNTCAACHTYTNDLATTHVNGTVDVNAAGTCTTQCHRNGTPVWTSASRLACESCHDGSVSYDVRFTNISAPRKSMTTFTQSAAHGNYGTPSKYVCTTCHSNTSSHIDGVRGSTNRLGTTYESNQNGLCSSCHSNSATVTNALRRITLSHVTALGGSATALCSTCHNVHGTANYASIVSSITVSGVPVAISHSATGTSFINTTTNRGLCQVCHTLTNHFRRDQAESGANSGYNSAGTDHSGFTATTDCLSCHTHSGGTFAFAPSGGTCDSCHGYPPVPRNTSVTINSAGNYLNAKFQNYTGGGGAHVVNNHVPKTVVASDGWSANCTKCHGPSINHSPSPINFKPSSNIKVNIDQRYRFVPTTQAKYSSNRLDGNLHVTNKCSNISCHFGATPAWNQR